MMNTTSARLSAFLTVAALGTALPATTGLATPLRTLYEVAQADPGEADAAGRNTDTLEQVENAAEEAAEEAADEAADAAGSAEQAGSDGIGDVDAAIEDRVQAARGPLARTAITALESDGRAYPVRAVELVYANAHPDLPDPDRLQQIMVDLLPTASGYVAPRVGAPNVTLRLADLPFAGVETMHASAANEIAAAVVRDFQDRGLMGVFVGPDPTQIQAAFTPDGQAVWGEDLRAGDDDLRLVVRSSVISSVRTVAQGDRQLDGASVNNPAHRRILENSPLQAGDLANRDEIDDYLYDLNRHPGRAVAAEVYPGSDPAGGDAGLGYIVSEAKPWTAFFNLSNTGTSETNEWRERFGLLHTQLTGHDDVLSLEYVTAGFEDSHAFFGSYERPFEDNDRLHGRVYASYQAFEASDIGFAGQDFEGETFVGGGELIWNFHQDGPSFLDLVVGARYENVHVDNQFADIDETEPFLVPYVGLSFERATKTSTTTAYVGIEANLDGVIGTDSPELDGLGRLNTDADWVKLPFSLTHSFYLEPLLNRAKWLDITSGGSTLAHELALSVRGQWTPESRLNPQSQQVAGGLFTVRGYDEAITAGDTVIIASAEYRLHIPKLGTPRAGEQRQVDQFLGQPFRRFPQQPYGAADWDLIPKAFIDAGRVINNDREDFEDDETLVGAGLGVDFIYKRNLNLRADWGVALNDAAGTSSGSQQFHFSFTFLY